jgi:hypothetical protein
MPNPFHQTLLFLLKANPRLVFELAGRFDARVGGPHAEYEVASNELPDTAMTETVLHADWVVAGKNATRMRTAGLAVEVETSENELKYYSWLSYAAGVRRLFRCRGWSLVFAPDEHVRLRAQQMFETEPRASPWFVQPKMLPPITRVDQAIKDVDRAVLTTLFHARSARGVACARATLEALIRVAHPHQMLYRGLVTASLERPQLEQIPKHLLEFDENEPLGPMELTGAYYTRGLEHGAERGKLAEARKLVLRVLERRGIVANELQERRISACEDLGLLERWLDRALVVNDATSLFE